MQSLSQHFSCAERSGYSDGMKLLVLLATIAISALGCSSQQPSAAGDEAKVVATARTWVASQGFHDPDAATYEAEAQEDGGWKVGIQYKPPTPGGHSTLVLNDKGEITNVWPGE